MKRLLLLLFLFFLPYNSYAFDPADHRALLDKAKGGRYHSDIKDHWADIKGGLEVVDDPAYNNNAANEMFALLGTQFGRYPEQDNVIKEAIRRATGLIIQVTWHLAPPYQHIHYLRDYPFFNLTTAKQSCDKANDFIKRAYFTAIQKYKDGNKLSAFHLYGIALHTIQDSFSDVHTTRRGTDLKRLEDLCTYEMKFNRSIGGVCHHPVQTANPLDNRDRAYKYSFGIKTDELNEHGKAAYLATANFLWTIPIWTQHLDDPMSAEYNIDVFINEFLSCTGITK